MIIIIITAIITTIISIIIRGPSCQRPPSKDLLPQSLGGQRPLRPLGVMYVCVYIYIYTHTHTHIYVCIYIYIMYIDIYIYTYCRHMCIYIYIYYIISSARASSERGSLPCPRGGSEKGGIRPTNHLKAAFKSLCVCVNIYI